MVSVISNHAGFGFQITRSTDHRICCTPAALCHAVPRPHRLWVRRDSVKIKDSMAAMIQAENVAKIYRVGKVDVPALRGVTFEGQPREFLTILLPPCIPQSTPFYLLA